MKLIALRNIGRLRPGDEFDVPANQGRALKAMGHAKDPPPPESNRNAPRYHRRDMQAEDGC